MTQHQSEKCPNGDEKFSFQAATRDVVDEVIIYTYMPIAYIGVAAGLLSFVKDRDQTNQSDRLPV